MPPVSLAANISQRLYQAALAQVVVLHICSSKLVFFSVSFPFDIFFFSCYTISGFPRCPCVLPDIEFLPTLIVSGELISADHGFCCDDDKQCIGDGVVVPLVFLLGILE